MKTRKCLVPGCQRRVKLQEWKNTMEKTLCFTHCVRLMFIDDLIEKRDLHWKERIREEGIDERAL